MEQTSSGTALEARLMTLNARIGALKQNMKTATAPEMVEDAGAIAQLKARHKILEEQLDRLDPADPTFSQKITAEIATLADDLTSAIDTMVAGVESCRKPR